MTKNQKGWMKAIGTGASAAGFVIAAAPLAPITFVLAALAFLTGMGGAAGTLYHDKPTKAPSPPAS